MKKIHTFIRERPLVLSFISGLLLSVGYRIPGFWYVLFFALIPLLFALVQIKSFLKAVWAGILAGIPLMGTSLIWLFDVLPLPRAYGVAPGWGFWLVFLSWTVSVLVTSFGFGIWTGLAHFLKLHKVTDILIAAFFWIGAEFSRLILFNILSFSPEIHNPTFMSAGFLGYPLMDSENLRQLAAVGGIFTCSFFVVLINLAVFYFLTHKNLKRQKMWIVVSLLLPLLLSILPIAYIRQINDSQKTVPVKVAILSVRVPNSIDELEATTPIADTELQFIRDTSAQRADIILLPEDSQLFLPFSNHTVGEYLAPGSPAAVNDSGMVATDAGTRPLRLFEDLRGGQVSIRDKVVLTPLGEYMPYIPEILLETFGAQSGVNTFLENRSYSTAIGDTIAPFQTDKVKAVTFFCLEVMDPFLGIQQQQENGDNLILSPASHLLFRDSKTLDQDILRFSQAQAVTLGLPLASSVKDGNAYILDKYGRVRDEAGENGVSGYRIDTVLVPKI